MRLTHTAQRGFTLIELLVVIAIIGILAALLLRFFGKPGQLFERKGFSVQSPCGWVNAAVLLPKPTAKHSVVIYLHGSGGRLAKDDRELQHFASLGMAAVGIEYNQCDQATFDAQFTAVLEYLKKQPWVQPDSMAWVGFSLGAQRSLNYSLSHPESAPQILVRLAGGWVEGLNDPPIIQNETRKPHTLPSKFQVLLVHGDQDRVFPVADCLRVAETLTKNGSTVETHVLPGMGHGFSGRFGVVSRSVAEYCAKRLAKADYAANAHEVGWSDSDAERFNEALQRAGQNRDELWRAVVSMQGEERLSLVKLIGGMEDYDLAHRSASHLRPIIQNACEMRRKHEWCRGIPLDIFARFSANPRVHEEPIDDSQVVFNGLLRREVKYSHNLREALDAVWRWMYVRKPPKKTKRPSEPTAKNLLGIVECKAATMLHTSVARSVGLAVRPAFSIDKSAHHFWFEAWDAEKEKWRAFDNGTPVHVQEKKKDIPLSVILTPTGDRGGWNAEHEGRWESFTNHIGAFFPSGTVEVQVKEHNRPVTGKFVGAYTGRFTPRMVDRARTDTNGVAKFILGASMVLPYRFVILGDGEDTWHWTQVKSNENQRVELDLKNRTPYDSAIAPPPLVF